jgi:polyvinyl alcohol dehydrogenase (cytochrome)
MTIRMILPSVTLVVLSAAPLAGAQVLQGVSLFEVHCASCHAGPTDDRTPATEALRQLTPEAVLATLTTGAMEVQASGLQDAQKRLVAEYVAGAPLGSARAGDAATMPNPCAADPFEDPFAGPMWNGWGVDGSNGRFQSAEAAGLTAEQVPDLTLKWAFGFPNGSSAYSQPTVVGGRVFVGSDLGYVYSLDTDTGCVHWSFQAQAGVRTAVSIGSVTGVGTARHAAYFGDVAANVYAVDAATGSLLWTQVADPHPIARITGAPTLVEGRLYVPVSSLEEAAGADPTYQCCTFRGAVVAYDASTGEQIWKGYTIPDEPRPRGTNSVGTQLWAPAGAATWSSPTVDLKRGAVYAATGNSYTAPAVDTSDSVVAFDIDTGELLWAQQATPDDAFLVGCGPRGPENCPDDVGPDVDFGNSVILRTLADGRDILVLGQKSGVAWGLDPDRDGEVVWEQRVGQGSAVGGMQWGSAADAELGYFPVSDLLHGAEAGGLTALRLGTGEQVWHTRPPAAECPPGTFLCGPAQSAAISVIPGIVFSGTVDGTMRAYSTNDGQILWEHNTVVEYSAVNGVQAKGGAIDGPGPTIVGGMLFLNSGYAHLGFGLAGNVLLAFGVD